MKMSKDRALVVILVPALIVVGGLALRGRGASVGMEGGANAATPPPAAASRPLTLSAAAQVKNPVKIAAAELA